MSERWAHLTVEELEEKYDDSHDDSEIASLEQELAVRNGFQSSDEWFEYMSGQQTQDPSRFTRWTLELDAGANRNQPYYLTESFDGTCVDSADVLCSSCRRLDFKYIISHLVPERELSLGYLEDIIHNSECSFCRMVVAAIRVALRTPVEGMERNVEVGLKSIAKSEDLTLFDIVIVLHPSPSERRSAIRIQQLAERRRFDFFGRLLTRHVDFELVKRWIATCESTTSSDTGDDNSTNEPAFTPSYLIDVDCNSIVAPGDGAYPYIALSYVWGGPQPLQLLLDNKDRLFTRDGLLNEGVELPATIADAMLLVRKIGHHYLWVDALCIVQDDRASKEMELRLMDQVYINATVTIIAAHGENVRAGLPGVSSDRRCVQHVEHVQGVNLVNRLPRISDCVDRSVWNSRAWTYQERILARRKLFISEHQVMFKCEHTEVELCEDSNDLPMRPSQRAWNDDEQRFHKWSTSPQSLDELQAVGPINTAVYSTVVQRFTSRQLTFANDILNAFIGVSNTLQSSFRDGFRFGLPKNELDTQLLWQPLGPIRRRTDATTGREIYPSWAWAGWVGPVTGNVAGRISTPEIEFMQDNGDQWFTMDQCRGVDRSICDRNWEKVEWSGHVFWRERDGKDEFFAHPVTTSRGFRNSCRPALVLNAQGSAEVLRMRADVGRLHIRGEVNPLAKLYLSASSGVKALTMYTDGNEWAGTVFVPDSVADSMTVGAYECVRISSTATDPKYWGHEPSLLMPFESCHDTRVYPPTAERRDQVDILLLETRDKVSYRLGAGVCHVGAFEKSNPKRQELLLG